MGLGRRVRRFLVGYDGDPGFVQIALASVAVFAAAYGIREIGLTNKSGYSVNATSPVITVGFAPGLVGYDDNKDGHLDRLVSQIGSYRPPIVLTTDVPPGSPLFKDMDEIYSKGFVNDSRLQENTLGR